MQEQNLRPTLSLNIIHDFWKAMVIKTLLQLSIPDYLTDGQKTVAELASATKTEPARLYRLLRAAAACQFICEILSTDTLSQKSFAPSEITPLFCSDQPQYSILRHTLSSPVVQAWNGLEKTVRSGEGIEQVLGMPWWDYLKNDQEANQNFNGSMSAMSRGVNSSIAQAYDFASETVADVGGGTGTFLREILRMYPTTSGIIFDIPEVMEQALQQNEQEALGERCQFVPGTFFEEISVHADIYCFKNVLHDWNDDQVIHILQNVRKVIQPGAKILIIELIIPQQDASFASAGLDLAMMIETGGRERTTREFEELLQRAHFKLSKIFPVGKTPYQILEAKAY